MDLVDHYLTNLLPYYPLVKLEKEGPESQKRRICRSEVHFWPYCQPNPDGLVSTLVFDIDLDPIGIDIDLPIEDLLWPSTLVQDDLPFAPSFRIDNPASGHSQVFYVLDRPRRKMDPRIRGLWEMMNRRLAGDPAYCRAIAKTPGHWRWLTTQFADQPYSLDYLLENMPPLPRKRPVTQDRLGHGRNNDAFHSVLPEAKDAVGGFQHKPAFQEWVYRKVDDYAHAHPDHSKPDGINGVLPESEIKRIAKSIVRYAWNDRRGNGSYEAFREDQRRLGMRSGEVRRARGQTSLRDAYEAVRSRGLKPTQKLVAQEARVTTRTVSRGWSALLKAAA